LGGQASRLVLLVVALAVWQLAALHAQIRYLPPFSEVVGRFFADWFSGPWYHAFFSTAFIENGLPTIGRLAVGWLVAAVLGVAIGTALALAPRLDATLSPVVRFGMSMPTPALLPLALAIFGLGYGAKVFFIAIGAIWPVIVNTADGIRGADPTALAAARSLSLPPVTWLTRFRIPLASPQIMAGLRVSVNTAVLLIVVAELYAATSGIGFFIVSTQRNFDTVGTWSGILLLAGLGIVCNALFVIVERRVMRWHGPAREVQ
jgi:ABC-type nitrate/sulfonate/bicarbonate transport system permease component